MKKLCKLLTITLLTFFLVSCGNDILEENKLYTVKFEENGGKEVEDIQDIKKGSTITLPTIERPGYIFKGWYTSKKFISGTEITNETPIGKNITIYAKWEAINYTLNINLDGGSLTNGYYSGNNGVTYGQEIDLGTPKKDGYLFEGWFKNNAEFDGKLVIDGNVNVTAKWINIDYLEKEYALTLHLNGGEVYKYNSKEELAEEFYADFTRFTGRNIDATTFWDSTYSRIIGDRGFFMNKTYLEKWGFLLTYLASTARDENKEYILDVFNGDNLNWNNYDRIVSVVRNEILAFFLNTERAVPGWGEIVSANYAKEELQNGYLEFAKKEAPKVYQTGKGIELPNPLKEGYVFLGWYDNSKFEGKVYTDVDVNEYGNKEFYALWGQVE